MAAHAAVLPGRVDVASLVHGARFNERDVQFATEGQCASFALALHDVLEDVGCPCHLHVVADHDYLADSCRFWSHVVVVHGGSMYDIRGLVGMHDNAMFGTHAFPITPAELRADIADLRKHHVSLYDCRDRYATWRRMLSRTQHGRLGRRALPAAPSTPLQAS